MAAYTPPPIPCGGAVGIWEDSNPETRCFHAGLAGLAQLVVQRICNPKVGSSSLSTGTIIKTIDGIRKCAGIAVATNMGKFSLVGLLRYQWFLLW